MAHVCVIKEPKSFIMLLQNVQIEKLIFDLKLIYPRFAHSDHSEPFGDMKYGKIPPKDQTKFKRYFKFVDRWYYRSVGLIFITLPAGFVIICWLNWYLFLPDYCRLLQSWHELLPKFLCIANC